MVLRGVSLRKPLHCVIYVRVLYASIHPVAVCIPVCVCVCRVGTRVFKRVCARVFVNFMYIFVCV